MKFLPVLLVLAGCAAAPAAFTYAPPEKPPGVPRPLIGDVLVVDQRFRPPSEAGSVLGYDGKPLKRLVSVQGVPADVQRATHDALAARGDLAPLGGRPRYDVVVTLRDLDSSDAVDYLATTDIVLRLVSRRDGRAVYTARVMAESRGDNQFSVQNGAFGSTATLNRVGSATLTRALDRALDHGGFSLALR